MARICHSISDSGFGPASYKVASASVRRHMKQNAAILKFDGKEIKTLDDHMEVLSALLRDMTLGAISMAESKLIQKQTRAMMKEFAAKAKEAKEAKDKTKLPPSLVIRGYYLKLPTVN